MSANLLHLIPGIDAAELAYLQAMTKDLDQKQLETFAALYNGDRRKPDNILIGTILGFVIVAGVQRFMVGQIGMGLLYLFTGGLCLIGTIIDLVNYKKLTFEYNQEVASKVLRATIAMS